MFNFQTILPGTNNIQHIVQGPSLPSTNQVNIVNIPHNNTVVTITPNSIIKNK